MAKELQPIERQMLTPNVPVKSSQAYATMGQATATLGNLLTNVLEEGTAYYSGRAGEEAALSGNTPKNLLPPLNKATAAYNKAVIETETQSLSAKGQQMIAEAYTRAANPATFTAQSPAEFNAQATGIVEGILDSARPEIRNALTQSLNDSVARAKIKMLDESINYDNKRTVLEFNSQLDMAVKNLDEAINTKDKDLINAAKQNVNNLLTNYSLINEQIRLQVPDIARKIEYNAEVQGVVADYIEAYTQGNEVAFLDSLTKAKPAGFTDAQYFESMQKVLQIERTFASAESKYNNEQYAKAHYEIVTGQIDSLEQLREQYGSNVPAASFYSLSEMLLSQKKAEDSVYAVERARYFGAQEVEKLPSKTLNDYYIEKERQIVNEINSNLKEGELPVPRLNLAQRAELIVAPAGASIPNFITDLSYGLQSSDPLVAMDAFNAYRYLFRNMGRDGNTLKGLDSKADDIAQYVLTVSDVSEADIGQLIVGAQNNVNDTSDATMAARRDRLKQLYALKDGVNTIQSTYKGAYGTLPNNPNSDAHYGTFQKLFDSYFMGVANGNQTIALSLTQNALRDWGKSRFGQKDEQMYAPPDMIPFANLGYWMDNQYGEALNGLLSKHEEKCTGIARPKWMAELPISDKTTDNEFMDTKFYPKYSALVDGIEREIYVQSTKNTRTSEFPGEVYWFYYLDDYGVKQYLNDPDNELGAASWMARSMAEFVPEVFRNLKEESFNEMAYEIYAKENKGKADDILADNTSDFYTPFFIDKEDVDTGRKMLLKRGKLDKAALEEIKQRLKDLGKKKIVFKDGKPVEGEQDTKAPDILTADQKKGLPPMVGEDSILGVPIELDDIGRRK